MTVNVNGLYLMEPKYYCKQSLTSCTQENWNNSNLLQLHQWHQRLGHPSIGILEKISLFD